jgi:hypothetical protein
MDAENPYCLLMRFAGAQMVLYSLFARALEENVFATEKRIVAVGSESLP